MSDCCETVFYQDAPPWLPGSPLASPLRSHEAEGEAAAGAPRHHHWSLPANTGEVSKAKVQKKEAIYNFSSSSCDRKTSGIFRFKYFGLKYLFNGKNLTFQCWENN